MEHGVVQLVRGSGFIFACRVGGAVLALVTQWVLARWMGAEDLGSYLLAYSWCILVARLSGLGYNSAAPRFIAQGIALDDRRAVRGFVDFSTRAALGVGTAVALIGVSATFALATRSGVSPWPMVIAFAAVPIMAYSGLLQGFALAVSDLRSSFVPNEVLRPALFLAAIGLIWWLGGRLSVAGVMLLQVGSITAALIVIMGTMDRRLKRDLADVIPSYQVEQWTRTSLALTRPTTSPGKASSMVSRSWPKTWWAYLVARGLPVG